MRRRRAVRDHLKHRRVPRLVRAVKRDPHLERSRAHRDEQDVVVPVGAILHRRRDDVAVVVHDWDARGARLREDHGHDARGVASRRLLDPRGVVSGYAHARRSAHGDGRRERRQRRARPVDRRTVGEGREAQEGQRREA